MPTTHPYPVHIRKQSTTAPSFPLDFVGRPRFHLKNNRHYDGGTAFLAITPTGTPLLISALHVVGFLGGKEGYVSPAHLHHFIESVSLYDLGYNRRVAHANHVVAGEVLPMEDEYSDDTTGDIMSFGACHCAKPRCIPVAQDPTGGEGVCAGERIYIVGCELKYKQQLPRAYSAVVRSVCKQAIIADLDELHVDLTSFSGSPVVSARGELVGMVSGGDDIPGRKGHVYSNIFPLSMLHDWFRTADV